MRRLEQGLGVPLRGIVEKTTFFTLQMSAAPESPGVTVVQLSDDQTVQVQRVIQAPQPSVIQSPPVQTVQVRTFFRNLCSYLTRVSCGLSDVLV